MQSNIDSELELIRGLIQGLTHRIEQQDNALSRHDKTFNSLDNWTRERQTEIQNLFQAKGGNDLIARISNAAEGATRRINLSAKQAEDASRLFVKETESISAAIKELTDRIRELELDLGDRIARVYGVIGDLDNKVDGLIAKDLEGQMDLLVQQNKQARENMAAKLDRRIIAQSGRITKFRNLLSARIDRIEANGKKENTKLANQQIRSQPQK